MTPDTFRRAHSTATTPQAVAADLFAQFGNLEPRALVLFCAPTQDSVGIAHEIQRKWQSVRIVGCSTAGEISTQTFTQGGVSAAALGADLVGMVVTTVARFDDGVKVGVARAVAELEHRLGQSLKTLSPEKYVGLVFPDSTHGTEELLHVELGNHAPFITFVGGSAGDNAKFLDSRVQSGATSTARGAALMVLELKRPFEIVKGCHYLPEPGSKGHLVTKATGRMLYELDGRPAAEVYAENLECKVEELSYANTARRPAGLLIDGQPWIRQCGPPFHVEGAVTLGCEIAEGSRLHFMRSSGMLVDHFKNQMDGVAKRLGRIEGALLFDCALRRFELEATGTVEPYRDSITYPAVGFHTHGESLLGHIHQTLTALVFG